MPAADVTPLPSTFAPRPRVLVVDDEPLIRAVARLMLERAGYAVDEAADADEAVRLAAVTERPFAVVVLDVTLPGRSGLDVLADLRACDSRACVVLTSGRGEEDLPGHGADGFLPKPFTRDQLVAAVRAAAATSDGLPARPSYRPVSVTEHMSGSGGRS